MADKTIVELAAQHDGVISRSQLVAAGVNSKAIYRRTSKGRLKLEGNGVYTVAALCTERTPIAIATAAVELSVASHMTAAGVHGLWVPSYCRVNEVEVTVARKGSYARPGVIVHETRRLPESHTTLIGSLPITTVARTFRDVGFLMSPRAASHMAQRIIADGAAEPAELAAVHLALARRGRAGTVFMRELLESLLATESHPTSELEIRMKHLLQENGIGGFQAQYKPPWYAGADGVADFADPERKIIIEVDGRRWHSVQQQLDTDRHRDRLAQRHGWASLRFNWAEVAHEAALVVEHIRAMCHRL